MSASPSRFAALALVPLSYAALHAAAILLAAPGSAGALSLGFNICAPALAMLAAWRQCLRTSWRPADGWSLVGLAFLLWCLGMAAPLAQERIASASAFVRYADILLFVLYAVPLTWIAASPFRHRNSRAVQLVDGALALALGVLFFKLTVALATHDGSAQISAAYLAWLFDVENLYLLACIRLRHWAAATRAERELFASLLVFASIYFVVAAFNNHVATLALNAEPGSLLEILVPLPFLAFVAYTLPTPLGKKRTEHRALVLRTRYVRSASPLIMCVAVLGTGLALAHSDYAFGVCGVLVAVAGYALRNVLREVRHVELRAMLRSKQSELEALTLVDGLTGVANRRALDLALERDCRTAIRNGQTLGVLLIDIDFFKLLNDTSGHQAGDESLRRVAQTLSECLKRSEDLLARYGGEEFVVLLPGIDRLGCATMAENLRAAIEQAELGNAGAPSKRLSISVGVACDRPSVLTDRLVLLRDADEALYQAKRGGRNRVALAWEGVIKEC
ncbi:GGDEF domain-containing protein [Paucibacter sp. R3-3]|uniref:diguanylate cyclase n=1 Tax=Roseateles agri TaxID=3098619 RepID=A0ABU5DCX3_9BURK|nr:GGDEF domain-containing protein [Paucibacter sp. R3-3]MDY0744127.1 GGDEF domain-containing protein [Paucibacter sp. R3-3]